MLCFDLSKPETFAKCEFHLQVYDERNPSGTMATILVGCKNDLKKEVDAKDIDALIKKYPRIKGYVECSAFNFDSTKKVLEIIVSTILSK